MERASSDRDIFAIAWQQHSSPALGEFPADHVLNLPPTPDWPSGTTAQVCNSLDSIIYASQIADLNGDVVHVSHTFEGFAERAPLPSSIGRSSGQVLSATLYDLIPLRFPHHYFASKPFEHWYRERLAWLSQTDLLLSISESSRQDAIQLLGLDPDRIVTIHGGISDHFVPTTDKESARRHLNSRYEINRDRFVMYGGGDDFRKNLTGAIQGYAAIPAEQRRDLQLVIVCALEPHRRDLYRAECRKAGLADGDVVFTGHVPEADLVALYGTCDLFFFPSLYEGLGLPVLEAMACDAPTIGGNNSSIRELIENPDALFDVADPASISEAIVKVLESKSASDDLREHGAAVAKKFTWEASAAKALDAIDDAITRKHKAGVSAAKQGWFPRKRLAVVTPLPPARSGIADYNAEFLPFLGRYFDIDLYVTEPSVSSNTLNAAYGIYDVEEFADNAVQYDSILYEIGNSEFHVHMLDLLKAFPGTVTLHDAYLSGLAAYMEFNLGEANYFTESMLQAHGSTARAILAPKFERDDAVRESVVELPCSKGVLDAANGVISHSPFNLEVARRFYPEGWAAPYRIIPQMVRKPAAVSRSEIDAARSRLGYASDDFIVASFGHVAWTKWGDRLLDAFQRSALANDTKSHLVFVGELAKDNFGDTIAKQIRSSGLGGRVRVTGFASQDDYEDYLRITDVAVQLRGNSRGGTPKGALDCLAYGTPLIVNNDASYRDYPDDVVHRISPNPDVSEIADALEKLRLDPELVHRLASCGRQYVTEFHDPSHCAALYAVAINEFTARQKAIDPNSYAPPLAPLLSSTSDPERACKIAASSLSPRKSFSFARRRMIVDVSYTSRTNPETGISRVVKKTVNAGYCRTTPGVDTIAVRREGNTLVEATDWLTEQGLLLPNEVAKGKADVEFQANDILLMLDSSWHEYSDFGDIFQRARNAGASIVTAIYDLLPLTLPADHIVEGGRDWFARWVNQAVIQSDGLVCISKHVADEVIAYIEENKLGHKGLKVGYWYLGSDAAQEPDARTPSSLPNPNSKPYVLMVGTIEPRKNHALALDAFEQLWKKGAPLNLVIAGRGGWLVDAFLDRLQTHPMLNKRLFVVESPSDNDLATLYRNATALLFVSKGEGFGLPLVEAAAYGVPAICSDIAVFREIADGHAQFVDISDPEQLASELAEWWTNYQGGSVPQPLLNRLTWEESTEALIDVVVGQKWYWEHPDVGG